MKRRLPTIVSVLLVSAFVIAALANVPIKLLQFQSDVDGGNFCITNLSCIQVGGVTANSGTFTNLTVLSNFVANGVTINNSNQAAVEDGYTMTPVAFAAGSNTLTEDFSQTNSSGQHLIYAKYQATNDVVFNGQTGMTRQWLCLSYVITASASPYVRIWMPTNGLVHFPTNYGPWIWYPSNQWIVLYLTNGFAFRDSLQTNDFMERQWIVK